MTKSVVTGGGGFLGSAIVRALRRRGDRVVTVSRNSYAELDALGVEQVRCRLEDLQGMIALCRGADRVFHVAARVGVWGSYRDYYSTNVIGTENVLAACFANRVPRLIYSSSPSVVFDGRDHRGVDESYPYATRWLSPYPRSKKIAEERVLALNGVDGLATIALRPHLIWGPGDRLLIPRVIEKARARKLFCVGNGKNRVDIIHVENAANAHLAAAEHLSIGSPCAGKAYFLSQGAPVFLWDFIGEILARNGIAPIQKSISFKAAYRVGACLEVAHRLFARGEEPRMTRFLAHQLAKDHFYDIGAAVRDFGYRPERSTRAGLEEMFAATESSSSSENICSKTR